MGLGPVSGVLGVVSTVSGMAQQKQQAAIQQAQADANAKAAEASAAQRKAQLDTQHNYAEYQSRMNALARQQQFMQSDMALQASSQMDALNYQNQQFALKQQAMQAGLTDASTQMEVSREKAGVQQQALGMKSQAAGQSAQNQRGIANQANQVEGALGQGTARRAMLQAMMASTGESPGRSSDVLVQKDMENDVASAFAAHLQQLGMSEADLQQLQYSGHLAEVVQALGLSAADFKGQTSKNQLQYANTVRDLGMGQAASEYSLQQANQEVARNQLKGSALTDANADRVNSILSDYNYNLQSQQVGQTLNSQMNSINAQRAAISSQGGSGLAGLLTAGSQLYGQVSGLFGGGKPDNSAYGQVSQSPSYGILSTGQTLPTFNSSDFGQTKEPTAFTGSTSFLSGF